MQWWLVQTDRQGRQGRQGGKSLGGREGLKVSSYFVRLCPSYDNGSVKGRKRFWKRQPKNMFCELRMCACSRSLNDHLPAFVWIFGVMWVKLSPQARKSRMGERKIPERLAQGICEICTRILGLLLGQR